MTGDKKWQKHKCLAHLPVVENITGRHKFFGMSIMKLVKKIQISVKKHRAKKGIIASIISCINNRYRVITFIFVRRNPVIKDAKGREQKKYEEQSAPQNKSATLGHI